MANTIHLNGKFQLDKRYDVLDVVTNGKDSYVCVRANEGADVTDTHYWVLLAKGADAVPPKLEINSQGNFTIDGKDTGTKAQGPAGNISNTFLLTDDTDLNFTLGNGFFVKTEGKVVHGPTDDAEKLEPFTVLAYGRQDSVITQILHATATNDIYVRSRVKGAWTDWRQVTQWN